MSSVSSTTSSTTAAASEVSNNAFAEMSSTEFIGILVTELTTQDPFEPNDSAAILEQLSSLRNIESQANLAEQLETMVSQNTVTSATGMIGQYITGTDENSSEVEGVVQSVLIENGEPILKLADGSRVPADNITDVQSLGDYDTQIVQQLLRNLIILNSSALVGKMVSGFDENNKYIQGLVTSVVTEDDDLILELDNGKSLSAGSVTRFADSDAEFENPDTTDDSDDSE